MNRHILEKLIHYAIYYVVLESYELIPSLATENAIKARIELELNKEDFFNKSIEKILQIIIDIDWRTGKQIRTNLKKKEYQPYVSNFNRGDGSSSLSINERYSIITCERLTYSVKEWIDSTDQVIRLIEEEIKKLPVNLRQNHLDDLQDMLAVVEQELQELGINSEFLREKKEIKIIS